MPKRSYKRVVSTVKESPAADVIEQYNPVLKLNKQNGIQHVTDLGECNRSVS